MTQQSLLQLSHGFSSLDRHGMAVLLREPEDTVKYHIRQVVTIQHKNDLGYLADDAATN
jgi:hypothetical protein